MIIIEGAKGKSRVLEDMINNQIRNTNMIIIDSVGLRNMKIPTGVMHLELTDFDVENFVLKFDDIYYNSSIKFIASDWIVFSINMPIHKIKLKPFKEIDREYPQNFILTVQNDLLDEVIVYHI